MKRNTKGPAMKLVEEFDQQLREILMSDLKAIRNGRIKLIKHITFNNPEDRLMTA
jgi:hypothetical protein